MPLSKTKILDELFKTAPSLLSEDDCAENIVIPFLLRLGYDRQQMQRKVTITGFSGRKFRKQADIILFIDGRAAIIVETKKLQHRLREEDANQVLSYAQLVDPPAPFAILTNGKDWEVYKLFDEAIGDLSAVPEPDELSVTVGRLAGITIPAETKQAAERLLLTIENREDLEEAFRNCRKFLAREGLIAETAFDELTKILVCKFNEEKRHFEGLGTYRFKAEWAKTEGPVQALREMFVEARQRFRVFPAGTQINLTNNQTVLDIIKALESFGFYGFKTPLGLAGAGGDIVGSVYETFLTGTLRGDLGQYLTPRQLVDFMVEIADVQVGERVLDLSAGSGGFLIRTFLEVRKKIRLMEVPQSKKDQIIEDLVLNHLWGVEINERLATLARINLILHGDGYEHIYTGDSIRDTVYTNTDGRIVDLAQIEAGNIPKFDLILMNPPFNLPYDEAEVLNKYDLGRGKSAQGSDFLMLERALRLLDSERGRLLIIMPHGVASGTSEKEIRDYVKAKSHIRSVISLPVGAFKPFGGSNARTCILYLTKSKRVSGSSRFLAQVEAVGYDITSKYYKETNENDLLALADHYHKVAGDLIR